MAPAVGGVYHGPVNARPQVERPRRAYRRRQMPWPAAPTIAATTFLVDCYVFGTPPLNFDGAGCRQRHPQPYQRAPSIETGADGPQAEERAKAADAHCIAWVPCDEFLFLFFSLRLWKKHCPKIAKCGFLFEQSLFVIYCKVVKCLLQFPNRLISSWEISRLFFFVPDQHRIRRM